MYMKISCSYNLQNSRDCINYKSGKSIAFSGFWDRDKFITKLHLNPLWHFKDFSKEEYDKLNERELALLRKRYGKLLSKNETRYTEIEKSHCQLAKGMCEYFDRIYGKGKYTVIIIGRSLSLAGKALGYLIGEDKVKNLPLSGVQKYTSEHSINQAFEKGKLKNFVEFLNSIGLSKKEVSKSNKHKFVLVDFCYSGYSLMGANDLLQSNYVYGKRRNIKSADVISYCLDDLMVKSRMMRALFEGEFKEFAFVKQCHDMGKIKKSVITPLFAGRKAKLVWFNILDKMCRTKAV